MILAFAVVLVVLRVFYSLAEMVFERDWPRSTWRGLVLSLALLGLCASAFGQSSPARVDVPIQTSGPSVPVSGGPLPQTLWVANSTVALCIHPQSTYAGCVANPLQTYTDLTLGSTCPTATPLVQLPGNTCTADTGTTANIGFWYNSALGSVDYYVVSSYGTYGPFTITPGGGGGGGSVPAGLNGASTYYQGTPGGGTTTTVGVGPGTIAIPSAVNDGATDATSAINAALALGYPLQLNDNCRGGNSFYALAGQLLISDTSAVSLQGSGGTGATFSTGVHCQTRLVFSGTTAGAVGLVVQATSTHNLTNILLKNLNLSASFSSLAAGIGLTVNCAASAPTQKGVCNDFQADNVFITGFPQGTYFTNLGNVHIGTLYTQGTPNSIGWMNQWGGSSTSPGSGSNSVVVDKLWGEDSSSETNTSSSIGFLNITTGTGYKVAVGDLANYTHGIQVGGFETSGSVAGAWDVGVTGGSWPVAATADITFLNQDDTVLGPMLTVGTSSHVTVKDLARPNLQYLGPRFQVASGGFLHIDEQGGPGVAAQAFGSITQTAGSSAYTSGVQYWFWAQYENTAAQLGAITVEWHSAVGPSVNTTITTNGNTVTLGAFATATANVACVNIYRGTTSAFASSTLISSCATLPYVSNGSESTGAAPTASNVPMVYAASPNSVSCSAGIPGAAAFAISGTVYQLQDIQGNYANICNGFTETPNQATPTALQGWVGYPQYQPPPTSGTGSDHLWVGRQTITSGTLAFSQFDMFNISLPISTTVNDITTGLFLKGSQQGLGTAAVGAMLQMTCTNTGANVCVPAFFENLSSTAGANVATFTDANGSVTLNNNLMTVQGRPELIEPFTAAISGTNQSSPKLSWAAFGFQTTTSGSTGATIALANVISNTTNTPTSVLTATVSSGTNLTPVYSADLSALTGGIKLPPVNGVTITGTGTTTSITGTALTATCDSGTVVVSGAVVGHAVGVSSTTGADVGGAFNLRASVTSTNTVTVYICGTGTPASLAYNVVVF